MKIYVFMFLCQNQKIMSKRSSLPRVGRVARSAGRVETAVRWYEQRLSLFYPLRPRKARSRPPNLWGQLKAYVNPPKKTITYHEIICYSK